MKRVGARAGLFLVPAVLAGVVSVAGPALAAAHSAASGHVLLADGGHGGGNGGNGSNGNGGNGNGKGKGGGKDGGGTKNVPEAPYALIFPAVLAAAGIVAYRRKLARS